MKLYSNNCQCRVASFDVNLLFTNIPLEETLGIIMNDIETSSNGTVCSIADGQRLWNY